MWRRVSLLIGAVALMVAVVLTDRGDGGAETEKPVEHESAGAETAPEPEKTPEPETAPEPAVNEPTALDERGELPMMEALSAALDGLREPPETFSAWLKAFAATYDSQREPIEVVRADLDADGASEEWVAVLFEDVRDAESQETLRRAAHGAVIAYRGGTYELFGYELPEESYGRAGIGAIEDLTGDARPDIVWASYSVGAHTTVASFTVTSWADGSLLPVQGTAEMPNVGAVTAKDKKLALTGGLIGSAGAGPWQREYTDEYVVADHALVRADRTYASSPTSYHRLIDGLWAEALGQSERAARLLSEAIELDDDSYFGYVFETDDGVVEGGTSPEREAEFEATVEKFARLRLERLTRIAAGASPENACAEARLAAEYDADWLPILNSPFGYANPKWSEETICAGIDELEF